MAEISGINHFEHTKAILPEENKVEIEKLLITLKETREGLAKQLNGAKPDTAWLDDTEGSLRIKLDGIGGPVRKLLVKNLEGYSLGNYWYTEHMNKPETEVLGGVFGMLPVDPGDIRAFDIGSGTGRTSELAMNAIRELSGNEEAVKRFAQNLHAVDLMPRFVQETQDTLGPLGVPKENVHQGDFADLPTELRREQFHAAWILMNTLFYCTSERDLGNVMGNVEQSLAPGGIFLFDTIKLEHHKCTPNQDVINNFDDLQNLYSVLTRMYRENCIDPQIDPAKTPFQVNRYPIRDRMTGGEFRTREVLTVDFMQHVLRKMDSKLTLATPNPIKKGIGEISDDEAEKLGMSWIRENGTEEWLRREIAFRLKQMGSSEVVPFYNLDISQRKTEEVHLNLEDPSVDSAFRSVARGISANYTKLYYAFQKKTNLDN